MRLLTVLLLVGAGPAAAADPALVERVPAGVTPDPAQRKVVEALAAKVYELEVEYDRAGHVVRLFATNHEVRKAAHKIADDRPGLTDADAPSLAGLPRLAGLCFEKQGLTEKGLEVLRGLPLTDVRFHYMPAGIDPHFAAVVNGKDLDVLHVKHCFRSRPDVARLGGFPNLRYLVLDTTAAGPACVAFVKACPKIEVFELHRPSLTAEQFGELAANLPNVRWVEVKPSVGGAGALRHLRAMPKLEALMLSQWKAGALPYRNGLEHLVPLKGLKAVSVDGATAADLELLRQARPDLKVAVRDESFAPHVAADGTVYNRTSPIRWAK